MNPPLSAAGITRSMRRLPVRRKGVRGRRAREEIGEPYIVRPIPGTWRAFPPTAEPAPERARRIELLLRDPAAARRELLEVRLAYRRERVAKLEGQLKGAKRELRASAADRATPPAERFRAQVKSAVARAYLQAARERLREVEAELAQ
jgi:hypothetical protein